VSVEDLVKAADADRAAADAVKAAEVAARDRAVDVTIGDDLTKITGLGKSSERKLKGAGIVTYAQLAAVPVEMIATILGVPVEEVIEDEVVKQANALASN
jgi:predicted flap endonuclease-1-like 5' DNA nuclease